MKYKLVLMMIMVILYACGKKKTSADFASTDTAGNEAIDIIKNKCGACHRYHDEFDQLAPPFDVIADAYRKDHPGQGEFHKVVSDYLKDPVNAPHKLPEARKKYGPMAPVNLSEAEVKSISDFLYAGGF